MSTSAVPVPSVNVEVPVDVILEIIASLDALHDKETLAAFCLVSSAIRAAAQKRFFSSIHFTYFARRNIIDGAKPVDQDEETKSFRFLRTIREYPHLAQYVRHFHFNLDYSYNSRIKYIDSKSSWMDIVPRLTSLRGFYWEDALCDPWSSYNARMRAIVQQALLSPTLTTIALRGVAFIPPSLITHCPDLRALEVNLVKAHTEGEEYGKGPIYLDSLVMGTRSYSTGLGQFVEFFNPTRTKNILSLARLTALSIPTDYVDVMDISAILSICGSSLAELKLMVPRTAVYPCLPLEDPLPVAQVCPIVDLSSLGHLTYLEITGRIKAKWLDSWRHELANSPLPWIGHVLGTLRRTYVSRSRYGSQIRLGFEVEDLSIPSLEALPWTDVVQPLLQQKDNFVDIRIDFKCYYFTYDNTLKSVSDDIPVKPTLIPERIAALEQNVELQKLGKNVVFDRSETYDFRLSGY